MTAIEALKEHIEKTKQDKYAGGVETIDFIQSKKLGFEMGNVVKYAVRIEKLGKPEDCLKAAHYLLMQYEKLTKGGVFKDFDPSKHLIGPGVILPKCCEKCDANFLYNTSCSFCEKRTSYVQP